MKETTGLSVPDCLMNSAASSSAVPPISPIIMMPSVCNSISHYGSSVFGQDLKLDPLMLAVATLVTTNPGTSSTMLALSV